MKHLPVLITLLTFGSFGVVGDDAKDCANKFKDNIDGLISCINSLPSDEEIKQKRKERELMLAEVREERLREERRINACSKIKSSVEREKCLVPIYKQEESSQYLEAPTKPEKKSFFGELISAVVEGAIEGVVEAGVNEAFDLNCQEEVEVRSKTSQTMPGNPQYGTKTRTTVKTKKCP